MPVITTVLCLLIAYPAALLLSRLKPRTASILSLLFILPMWMNFLLRHLCLAGASRFERPH